MNCPLRGSVEAFLKGSFKRILGVDFSKPYKDPNKILP